jgi:hypothetical protein
MEHLPNIILIIITLAIAGISFFFGYRYGMKYWLKKEKKKEDKKLSAEEKKAKELEEKKKEYPKEVRIAVEITVINNKTDQTHTLKSDDNEFGLDWEFMEDNKFLRVKQLLSRKRNKKWHVLGDFINHSICDVKWKEVAWEWEEPEKDKSES